MKNLKNIGKALSREELKNVSGGIIGGGDFTGGSGGTTCSKNTCTGLCYVQWNSTCWCSTGVGQCTATYKEPTSLSDPSLILTIP